MIPSEEQSEYAHTNHASEASASTPASKKSDIVELLSRHAELAKLEFQVELSEFFRKLRLLFFATLLFTIGFCFLQITIFMGLVHIGLPIWAASLLLGFAYIIIAGISLVLIEIVAGCGV